MEPLPKSNPSGEGLVLPGPKIQGGGLDRFGAIADLAIVREQIVGLAAFYADEAGLGARFKNHPEVTFLCAALAACRQRQMFLLQQMERDLADQCIETGEDYGRAVFRTTQHQTYRRIQEDLRALHRDATRYRADLRQLADELKPPAQFEGNADTPGNTK